MSINEPHCTIWYRLYNVKKVKNIYGGVIILLVKLHAKCNTPPWVFFTFFKLYKWYQIAQRMTWTINSLDTGRKLNVHKTSKARPGRPLKVLYMFDLRLLFRGILLSDTFALVERTHESCLWKLSGEVVDQNISLNKSSIL